MKDYGYGISTLLQIFSLKDGEMTDAPALRHSTRATKILCWKRTKNKPPGDEFVQGSEEDVSLFTRYQRTRGNQRGEKEAGSGTLQAR
jgi:hypothetical protein